MGKYSIDEETLDALAEGARNAIGTYDSMTPEEMAERLDDLSFFQRNENHSRSNPDSEWIRPNNWPDIDSLLDNDPASDVIYMTWDADRKHHALSLRIETVSGDSTIEIGHINDSHFVIDETITVKRNTNYAKWMDEYSGMLVIRITGLITRCMFIQTNTDGIYQYAQQSSVVQRAARVPNLVDFVANNLNIYRWGGLYLVRDRIENGTGDNLKSLVGMEYLCHSLRSLDITQLKTQNATSMNSAFYGCYSMISIDLSMLDLSQITNMGSTFRSAEALKEINLKNTNLTNCAIWDATFMATASLEKIYGIDSIVSDRATTLIHMFNGAISLTSLDMSEWNTSNVTDISYMFSNCRNMKYLTMPSFTSKLTNISRAFYSCFSITKIDLSKSDLSKVTSFTEAFYNCSALMRINFPIKANSEVTAVNSMFENCYSLRTVNLKWLKISDKCGNVAKMFQHCRELQELDLPEWDLTNLNNNDSAISIFAYCYSIKRISGISNWKFGTTGRITSTFFECNSLTELNLNNWDISTVSDISNMFYRCFSLLKINISNWNFGTKAKSMSSVFLECESLKEVVGLSDLIAKPTKVDGLFQSCNSLRTFPDITLWDFSECTTMRNMYYGLGGLEEIDIHGLDLPLVTTVENMFAYSKYITDLNFSDWNAPLINNASEFARECTKLKNVYPSGFSVNHTYRNDDSLTYDSVIRILNTLPEVNTKKTLTFGANILRRLTSEEKKIATDKGWTLA